MFFHHHTHMTDRRPDDAPPASANRSWRRLAPVAAAACLLLSLPAPAQLPVLGDTSDMTSGAERKLGESVARELYRDPDYLDDPVLDEYIEQIWQRLVAGARARGEVTAELDERFAWQVLLGKDRIVNAFALPGGWMGVQLGLINVTTTRDELASVLAHEMSHVTQRHISRLMEQQNRQAPLILAAMILGAIAAGKSADAANAVIVGSQAAAMQGQLNFSRDMEREADRVGLGVMTQAGFDPQGFITMFDKLQQASRLNDNGSFPYLRTHPMTTERIAEMQSRQQLAARPVSPAAPDLVHAMMVGRSRALSVPGVDVLRSYVVGAQAAQLAELPPGQRVGALYGAALASAQLRDSPGAAKYAAQLAPLTAADPEAARLAKLLSAELAMLAGDPARAASLVDAKSERRPETVLLAQARVQAGQPALAASRLQTWVALHPRDAQAWQILASAYSAQGQTLRAIRAEAEAQVAHLDYPAAMDRFRAGQEMARKGAASREDHIEASIIDTRARAVESLLREQTLKR
jgi:predicted Zn-dependent protease